MSLDRILDDRHDCEHTLAENNNFMMSIKFFLEERAGGYGNLVKHSFFNTARIPACAESHRLTEVIEFA